MSCNKHKTFSNPRGGIEVAIFIILSWSSSSKTNIFTTTMLQNYCGCFCKNLSSDYDCIMTAGPT